MGLYLQLVAVQSTKPVFPLVISSPLTHYGHGAGEGSHHLSSYKHAVTFALTLRHTHEYHHTTLDMQCRPSTHTGNFYSGYSLNFGVEEHLVFAV